MKYVLILTLSVILLVGCVNVSVIPLGDANFYPTNNRVSICYSRDKIEKDYDEIAIITAKTGDADFVSDDEMLQNILTKAREIGADAVIYEQQTERASGSGAIIGGVIIQDTSASFRVTAIRYK